MTNPTEHTPEPWAFRPLIPDGTIIKRKGTFEIWKEASTAGPEYDICSDVLSGGPIRNEADARRIVACVNACQGIPIELLEHFKDALFAKTTWEATQKALEALDRGDFITLDELRKEIVDE